MRLLMRRTPPRLIARKEEALPRLMPKKPPHRLVEQGDSEDRSEGLIEGTRRTARRLAGGPHDNRSFLLVVRHVAWACGVDTLTSGEMATKRGAWPADGAASELLSLCVRVWRQVGDGSGRQGAWAKRRSQ